MASFNKLTVGNQTFDVSGVKELPAQWIQDEDGGWMLAIPKDLDYQIGQVYLINYDKLNDDLYDKNFRMHLAYVHDGVEMLVVANDSEDYAEDGAALSRLGMSDPVYFDPYTGVDKVTNDNVDVLAAYEEDIAPISPDIAYFAIIQAGPISQKRRYLIPYEAFIGSYTITRTTFYFDAGNKGYIPVKVLIDTNDDAIFVNTNTGNSIPSEQDDDKGGYILFEEDVIASNNISSGSSSGSVPVIATEYQSESGGSRSITTTNKNEYEIVSSGAPNVTSTVLIGDKNSNHKFINNSYFNSQANLVVDNTSDSSFVKAEFVGSFIFSVDNRTGGER